MRFKEKDKRRFWEKVNRVDDKNSCWEWTASTQTLGYGQFGFNGRPLVAHRVAWELKNGPIPKGINVLHRCDNRRCVRPSHLFLGTQKDNIRDMIRKGRARFGANAASGERHGSAKLNWTQVRRIRRLHKTGSYTLAKLGRMYGVTPSTIGYIIAGKTWKES